MSIRVLSAILRQPWAIDPRYAESYFPAIQNVLNGLTAFDKQESNSGVIYISAKSHSSYNLSTELPDAIGNTVVKNISVMKLSGPLMKDDQECGPMGMQKLGSIFKANDRNPNIHAHILDIDSPGGTVAGTEEFANTVKSATKPVITIVRDLMASAALWVGSCADEVYASKEHDEIGSIGVMMSFADMQPAYERLGVKFHTITAEQSKDKNRLFADLQKGNYDEYRKTVLNPLADQFIKAVKENYPNVKEDQLTGTVFFAKDVVGSLINGIKSFDEVVARAIELADASQINQPTKNSTSTQNKNTSMKTFKNLNASVGAELEVADGGIFLTEEQAAAADAALEVNAEMAQSLQTVTTERDNAITAEQSAQQTIAALTTEVAELKKKPGATSATVIKSTESGDGGSNAGGAVVSEEDDTVTAVQKVKDSYL